MPGPCRSRLEHRAEQIGRKGDRQLRQDICARSVHAPKSVCSTEQRPWACRASAKLHRTNSARATHGPPATVFPREQDVCGLEVSVKDSLPRIVGLSGHPRAACSACVDAEGPAKCLPRSATSEKQEREPRVAACCCACSVESGSLGVMGLPSCQIISAREPPLQYCLHGTRHRIHTIYIHSREGQLGQVAKKWCDSVGQRDPQTRGNFQVLRLRHENKKEGYLSQQGEG